MPRLTIKLAQETLQGVVQALDKRVQVVAVSQGKKEDVYRVTLLKDGKTSAADLKKEAIKLYLSEPGKGDALRKALGKAVSHLSIRPGR